MSKSIAKNTVYMTMASVFQKIVAFFYFTLVARMIGVENMGKYTLALSFTTIFVVFIDLGFTNVLIREASRHKERIQDYFSTVLSVKLMLAVLTYGAAIVTAFLLGYETEIRHLIYLSAVTMVFDSMHLSLYGVLRAQGDLKWEAFSMFGSQTVTFLLGSLFLWLDLPLIFLILAYTIPSLCNVIYSLLIARIKYGLHWIPTFDREIFFHLGNIAVPFAIAAIFARVYSYIDVILLSKLAGNSAVGLYSIATKVTFSFQFIPLALIAAVYPRFSEYFIHDRENLGTLLEQSLKYLMMIAFPIAIGVSLIARPFITLLYTDAYLPAVLPLQILVISLIFSFLSFPVSAFLNACNRQKTQTTIIGSVMLLNIVMNILFIPTFGIVGSALTAFLGNFFLLVLGYAIVPSITKISHLFLFKTGLQVMASTTVMGGLVYFLLGQYHIVYAIGAGAIVYPLMLLLTGCVRKAQIHEVFARITHS